MRTVLLLFLAIIPVSASAAESCAPVSTDARILASPAADDIHPDWNDGSAVGMAWSLDSVREEEGEDGDLYLFGDLINPRGEVATQGVFVPAAEWECGGEE